MQSAVPRFESRTGLKILVSGANHDLLTPSRARPGFTCIRADNPAESSVILRPTCEAMGLDYNAQLQRLKRQDWACVCMTHAHDVGGREQVMATIDRKTFGMWLATIDTSRLKNPDAKAKIVLYQGSRLGTDKIVR